MSKIVEDIFSSESDYEYPLPVVEYTVETLRSYNIQSVFVLPAHRVSIKEVNTLEQPKNRKSKYPSAEKPIPLQLKSRKSHKMSRSSAGSRVGWIHGENNIKEQSTLELESLLSSFSNEQTSMKDDLNSSLDKDSLTSDHIKEQTIENPESDQSANLQPIHHTNEYSSLAEGSTEYNPLSELDNLISENALLNEIEDKAIVKSDNRKVEENVVKASDIANPLAGPPFKCMKCKQIIEEEFCKTNASIWHPDHFNCFVCNVSLVDSNFFEIDYELYCQTDYEIKFLPKCVVCSEYIHEQFFAVGGNNYHEEHFNCISCKTSLLDQPYFERNNQPYCENCFSQNLAKKCYSCGLPIMAGFMDAMNASWHPACFTCKICRLPFQGGIFRVYEKFPYCDQHYHEVRGTLCYACKKPITGTFVTACNRKFHPDHLVCTYCKKKLSGDSYKEYGEKPYCLSCCSNLAN